MGKKTFPCGHKGLGKYCHLCAQKQQVLIDETHSRQTQHDDKKAWEALFTQDAIELRKLPHKKLVLKAREILSALARGISYEKLGGKRMNYNREVVSIPIGNDYRLLCRAQGNEVIPLRVLSHEEYNVKKPGA